MGCDGQAARLAKAGFTISIHAPAWGATFQSRTAQCAHRNFNPRTRMGCDPSSTSLSASQADFNPRTRMGCDGVNMPLYLEGLHFNPRTRMGCDLVVTYLVGPEIYNFNPRTRMGCDSTSSAGRTAAEYFNPRTRMGCDTLRCSPRCRSWRFQSTHPHGVRQ